MQPEAEQPSTLSTQEIAERLADTALFEGIAPSDLQVMAEAAQVRHVPPYGVVSNQQADEHDLYVVVRGQIEVWLDPHTIGMAGDAYRLATLFANEVAGELALVDDGVRSALLQASEAGATCIVVPQATILDYCDANAVFGYRVMRNLAAILALRHRLTTLNVQGLQGGTNAGA